MKRRLPGKQAAAMGRKRSPAPSKTFVLDCSVAVAWFFEDEANAYAEAVEDSLPASSVIVPSLWPLEIANALLMGERRNRATEAKVTTYLHLLAALPIAIDDETANHAWHQALALGRRHQLSVYDAAYLELALRKGLPLASLDKTLIAAAQAAGVPAYKP